jgi:uracil-DNA glycosylase family 4
MTSDTGFPRDSLNNRHQVIAGGSSGKLHVWWDHFNSEWKNCKRCPLHKHRNKVVQFRGIIPAQILFIGEAPWISEDEIGRPFCGPAGRELDTLIEQAGVEDGEFCLINVVGCIPREVDEQGRPFRGLRPPTSVEVKACSPRLKELIEHIKPKLVVTLGRVAVNSLDVDLRSLLELVHPSFILQSKSPDLLRKRFILTLKQAVERMRSASTSL